MKKNYVSNSPESVRMFKSDLLEALSKVHFFIPLIIYVPVIIYLLYKGIFEASIGLGTFILLLAGGLFVWTFVEYIMHRFIFHYVPKQKWALRLHFIFHGVHHDYPNDLKRLVLPPSASIPLALSFYFLFNAILPATYVYAFFPAFITGYLVYDMTHYAIHHFNFKSGIWKKIKQHHMLHHYQDPTRGYGVSSDLWDKIFRSRFTDK
ncbi:fatty acid hydroxylase [Mucilaginibacter sp. PPCGB 2223]|uniref:sterol desaturase family protein n=1 Tax=Mucilaginibacter sp. PPCGB 2223 TaxID=1886027 RepID=UPI00082546F6|nr:sterol desaturase family protein [Mucilaginibacter sp. PPCGB 2223]OCX52816.1 fatty acid hydroxylase [Mucilaginibacter sp. PPCGB 2223]